jgi:Ca2+-binding EF-hand superfamily protein
MIPTPVLSEALTTLGDKLSRSELNELLAMIENDKQECRYKLFIEAMFAKK